MRRFVVQLVASLALLGSGAVVSVGCSASVPAAQITTAPTSVPQEEAPTQVAANTDSKPKSDSGPTTATAAQITTAPTSTPQENVPAPASITRDSGPTAVPAAQITTAPTSVPQEEAPAQVAANTDSKPKSDSGPTTATAAQITTAPTSVPQEETPAQVAITRDSESKDNSGPTAVPAAQITTAPTSVPQEEAPAQVAANTGSDPKDDPNPPTAQITIAPVSSPDDKAPTQVVTDTDSEPKSDSGSVDSAQGQTYTWEDGDRTLTVRLQVNLVVQKSADGSSDDIVAANAGGGSIVKKEPGAKDKSTDHPVFRSESGSLMTLPGGVLLALDPEWTQTQTDAFFADNGIKLSRVSELSYIANGFFVETEPGFPSLELANTLAALDGVEVSSPNWWTEVTTK